MLHYCKWNKKFYHALQWRICCPIFLEIHDPHLLIFSSSFLMRTSRVGTWYCFQQGEVFRLALGTSQPPSQCVTGTSPEIKRPGREADGPKLKTKSKLFTAVASHILWGGADKSLARPVRKQPTATKLGIYSTCSQRSSIHFLARCPNFCKPLRKNFRRMSVRPGLRGSNDLRVGRKMATFQLFFQSRW